MNESAIKKVQLVTRVINFLNTTSGRDKSCRLVQYFPRIIKAVLSQVDNKNQSSLLFKRLDIISGQCSMTRKILRFFKQIGIAREIIRLIKAHCSKKADEKDLETMKSYVVLKVLGDLSLALFFLADHFLWLCKTNLINRPGIQSTADFLSNLFWLLDCVFTILHRSISLHLRNRVLKQQLLKNNDNSDEIRQQVKNVDAEILDVIRCVVDVPVALAFMKPGFLSDGLVGLFGTTTSLIGCWQNFK